MSSRLSWLDGSEAEQQWIRELLRLFTESEARDELGIGQLRDAFGELLFPGTSTLHTRARYLLIVPWCIQYAGRHPGRDQAVELDRIERRLITTMIDADATRGLIGRLSAAAVKTLPSTIYRSALRRYGIDNGHAGAETPAETTELTERVPGRWPPTLPPPPDGFPDSLAALELTAAEAAWLRENIMIRVRGTLLEHLLRPGNRPDERSQSPWDDSAATSAPPDPAAALEHARKFSIAMHGAALLYNLLLAEAYERADFTDITPRDFREALKIWNDEMATVGAWDRPDMWARLIRVNPRIAAGAARRFADTWLGLVLDGRVRDVADDPRLRDLVAGREKTVKKAQSRLVNRNLLGEWSGDSGTRPLLFRWPQVRRMVIDIHDGVEAADAVTT
ncbi:DUF6361 family protein [Actinoplanes rectilineatus]|uniref:DUF6361 family protein n=1 Tax=Actinoplanes rectilineatus TaxID=113571 RepID=UPI0005F29525|nr:DUF6361 family protein [Actinoplanes rectilineatus]